MKSGITAGRFREGASDWVSTLVLRLRSARRSRHKAHDGTDAPTPQDRQTELLRFYDRYEELVEALCDSAQYGPTPKLERAYQAHRAWLTECYPSLRPLLVAFLRQEPEDAEFGLAAAETRTDAFEALVIAADLPTFLRLDDGGMISRITRTREALSLYGEHLRQLVARTA